MLEISDNKKSRKTFLFSHIWVLSVNMCDVAMVD